MTPAMQAKRRAAARDRRSERYAIKFLLDLDMDSNGLPADAAPTDANLARVLRHCARRPRPAEYPAIRRHVEQRRAAGRFVIDSTPHRWRWTYTGITADDAQKIAGTLTGNGETWTVTHLS